MYIKYYYNASTILHMSLSRLEHLSSAALLASFFGLSWSSSREGTSSFESESRLSGKEARASLTSLLTSSS